jgi:competence protein ComEC
VRLVYYVLGWVCGIILASNLPYIPLWIWGLLLLGASFTYLINRQTTLQTALMILLFVMFGAVRFAVVPQSASITYFNGLSVSIEGVVSANPVIQDERIVLRVHAETAFDGANTYRVNGDVLVNVDSLSVVYYGDRVQVGGDLRYPSRSDTFSYAEFLARRGVFSIMPSASLVVLNESEANPFYRVLYQIKAHAQSTITHYLPEPSASLLTGILLGNQEGMSPQLESDFSKVGASHIIAISGFNMAVIAGLFQVVLTRLNFSERWVAVIAITFLVLYTLFVGAGATVVRAALMSSMLLIAPLLKRNTYIPATLASVVLFLTIIDPNTLWDVSFQLSFLAVLGLVLFVNPLQKAFDAFLLKHFITKTARQFSGFFSDSLIVTIAAQITTIPLMLLYFQNLSLVSLIVNVLIIPVQAVLMVLGGVALLLGMLSFPLVQGLFWLDMLLLDWTIGIVRLFANLPFASVTLGIEPRVVGLFYGVLIGGAIMSAVEPNWLSKLKTFFMGQTAFRWACLTCVGILALLVMLWLSRPDGRLHVWWLDVGHSHTVLIQTPQGEQILIDGGRFPSRLLTALGDRMPFNDREIDVLILTQPDRFDTGAIPAVLDRYDVGLVLTNGQPNTTELSLQLDTLLQDKNVQFVRAGYQITFSDGVILEVLNPQIEPSIEDSINTMAMVLKLTYGERSFLLTGGINLEGQYTLMDTQDVVADVVELPGNANARSLAEGFLEEVQPSIVVLQAELGNAQNSPNDLVIGLVGERALLRTDTQGTLHFYTDGYTLWSITER